MILNFISDTHADHLLMSGTTASNRMALRRLRHTTTMRCIEEARLTGPVIHGGDLFHSKNPKDAEGLEFALRQALRCDWVLAGNHDLVNNHLGSSAFQALLCVDNLGQKLMLTEYGESNTYQPEGLNIVALPHVATQELFETGIRDACETYKGAGKVLLLHCNILLKEHMVDETTLNLTEDLIKLVSETFVRTFVGHNHKFKEYNAGKIISIGTTYPTSFSDVSKSQGFGYVSYDSERDVVTHHALTSADCYVEREVGDFLGDTPLITVTSHLPPLVRIIGEKSSQVNLSEIAHQCYSRGALALSWALDNIQPLSQESEDGDDPNSLVSFDVVASVRRNLNDEDNETLSHYLEGAT